MTRTNFKKLVQQEDKLNLIFELIDFVLSFIEEHKIKDVNFKWYDFLLKKSLRVFTIFVIQKVIQIVKN